jgi:hypothetical protein
VVRVINESREGSSERTRAVSEFQNKLSHRQHPIVPACSQEVAAGKRGTSQLQEVRVPIRSIRSIGHRADTVTDWGSQLYRKPYANAQCVRAAGDSSTLTMIK